MAWSQEAILRNRRRRKARRYYRDFPVFAFDKMVEDHPNYSYTTFLDDIKVKNKSPKRKGKKPHNWKREWLKKIQHEVKFGLIDPDKLGTTLAKYYARDENVTKPIPLYLHTNGVTKIYELPVNSYEYEIKELIQFGNSGVGHDAFEKRLNDFWQMKLRYKCF